MAITKRVTFIAKEGSEAKMKELLSAMVVPSKAEKGVIFYEITFLFQVIFYGLALLGYYFQQRKIKIKAAFVPFYFSFMNLSVFMGLYNLIVGNYEVTWEKAVRK